MRVLHLSGRLSERGGAEICLLGLLRAQATRHDVWLAVGTDDGTAQAPCPVIRVPGLDSRTPQPVTLDRLVQELRPGLVHLHNVVNPTVLRWAASQRSLMTLQDHRFFCPGRGKWTANGQVCGDAMHPRPCAACFSDGEYYERIFALTSQRLEALKALRLVVLSEYMRGELIQAGVDAAHVNVVPPFVHGLDLDASADGPPCALFVGRLVEAKGVRDAVEAWRRSCLRLPLVLAGTGPLRAELDGPNCQLLGWVPHDRLAPLYRRAEAVLFPSRWQEPFGLVGLEALTLGTPVAAWDSGGVREWHGGTGLVPWGDIDGLALALKTAIGRPAQPPCGFDRQTQMSRLDTLYASL